MYNSNKHNHNGMYMEPNVINEPVQEQPTQPPQIVQPSKKSNKKLFLVIAIAIVVIAALAVYFVLNMNKPAKVSDAKKINDTSVVNPSVEAATSVLTGSAISEPSLTSTDNSNIANDASSAVGNLGDSVNENNF